MNPPPTGYLVSKGDAWYIFFLLFFLMVFDFIDRQVIASLFPYFKKEWGVSDTQCGFLVAAVHWSITVFVVPSAILADRWSRKKTVGLMSVLWSLATLACAFTTNFFQLIAARFTVGVGEAGYVPAGNALISALFPERIRATLMGIFLGAGSLGIALGVALGGWIAQHYGWRQAFGVVAIPGLIFAVLVFFIRDYRTTALTVTTGKNESTSEKRKMTRKEIIRCLLWNPSLLAVYIGTTVGIFFCGAVINWLPSYFLRVHILTVAEAASWAGLVFLISIIGNVLGGFLGDRLVSRGFANGRLLMAAFLQFSSFLVWAAGFGLVQGPVQFILFFLGGVLLSAYVGPVYSTLAELVHPGLRATTVSVMTVLINLLGFALGPIFIGVLSDRFDIGTAMSVVSFVPLFSMMAYLVGAALYKRDLARVEKVDLRMEDEVFRSRFS